MSVQINWENLLKNLKLNISMWGNLYLYQEWYCNSQSSLVGRLNELLEEKREAGSTITRIFIQIFNKELLQQPWRWYWLEVCKVCINHVPCRFLCWGLEVVQDCQLNDRIYSSSKVENPSTLCLALFAAHKLFINEHSEISKATWRPILPSTNPAFGGSSPRGAKAEWQMNFM